MLAARLRSGRALAYEGLSQWRDALADYTAALDLAAQAGESPDAYIINAIGNCHNSMQQWAPARESYLTSSQLFQQAKVCVCVIGCVAAINLSRCLLSQWLCQAQPPAQTVALAFNMCDRCATWS